MPKRKMRTTKAKAGIVAEITENDLNKEASVTVRHGPKPKQDKQGHVVGDFPETTHLKVPRGAGLTIGDKVEIELRKSGGPGGQVRV